MKKYLLSLLTLLVVLSSCEKENDLLQPIPQNPSTQVTTNTDTTTVIVSDTTITYNVEEELVVDYSTINTTNTNTVPTTFIGEGKTWKIVESRHIHSQRIPKK